jgi:hypothetical protein
LAEEGCPVCQFLAEKPIPTVPGEEVSAACLEQKLAPAGRLPGARQAPACYQVRGPPAVA